MRLAKSIALFMSIVLFPSCNGAMVVTYPDALQVGSQQYRITSDGEIQSIFTSTNRTTQRRLLSERRSYLSLRRI